MGVCSAAGFRRGRAGKHRRGRLVNGARAGEERVCRVAPDGIGLAFCRVSAGRVNLSQIPMPDPSSAPAKYWIAAGIIGAGERDFLKALKGAQ
jgi:hypothetical protein